MSMGVFGQPIARFGGVAELPLEDKTALLKYYIRAGLIGPPAEHAAGPLHPVDVVHGSRPVSTGLREEQRAVSAERTDPG